MKYDDTPSDVHAALADAALVANLHSQIVRQAAWDLERMHADLVAEQRARSALHVAAQEALALLDSGRILAGRNALARALGEPEAK